MRFSPSTSTICNLEALACLLAARACIAALPFRHVRAWLGSKSDIPPAPLDAGEIATATRIAAAIDTLCTRAPVLGSCLPQAMAAAAMLRRRGISCVAHFGVITPRSEGDALEAHVWLTAAEIVVTGATIKSAYTEIGTLS
jgi:hypothetical protein